MNIEYSRQFVRSAQKLNGKYRKSLRKVIINLKSTETIHQVRNCIKLAGFDDHYRIRMGNYRIILLIRIVDQTAFLQLLLSRGEVYKKGVEMGLRKK